MLKIGYAQNIITPPLSHPVFLAGFGVNRRAESVHDDLYARAVCLELDRMQVALVALDILGLYRMHWQDINRAVQAQMPGLELLGASTHTHHGPDTMGMWGPNRLKSGVDEAYMSWLKQLTIDTVVQAALRVQEPAWVKSACVRVPGMAKNARDPHIVDDELTCLQFCAPGGQTLASVFNFPCHPEVLWEGNPHITSDYPGYLRQAVEAQTGSPCLFFSGALGGMMTPDVTEHSFGEAHVMGQTLAEAGLQALASMPAQEPAILELRRVEFGIPLDNIVFRTAMLAGLLPKEMDVRGVVVTEASLLRLGDCWLAGVPGELLPALGLEIKQRLRQRGAVTAGVIGLAGDELGYILPQKAYVYPHNPLDPGEHYEETMSVGPEAGPRLMGAVTRLLD